MTGGAAGRRSLAVVAGAVANKAGNGGATWTRLSWAGGLRRLGFDVHFVEQLSASAPRGATGYFDRVMADFGLSDSATLLRPDGSTAAGLSLDQLGELSAEAALLLNISGHLRRPEVTDRVGVRVFVDLDPGYTQIWDASDTEGGAVGSHDFWFTVGENVGRPGCPIPTNGRPWLPTRQPVGLADWPVVPPPVAVDRFTTVGSWRGAYGPVAYGGRTYGVKAHQFRRFLPLPQWAPGTFELALEIHPADDKDRASLEEHGWRLADVNGAAGDPFAFRRYVQGSAAEFSVAQSMYVDTASGWFSDRTVRYLASGRPALVQETGFSRVYPTGEGLVAFTTLDDAVAGAAAVLADYDRHCRAARSLAEEFFAAERVLGELCEEVGVGP